MEVADVLLLNKMDTVKKQNQLVVKQVRRLTKGSLLSLINFAYLVRRRRWLDVAILFYLDLLDPLT